MNFSSQTAAFAFFIALGIGHGSARADEAGAATIAGAATSGIVAPFDVRIDLPPIGADLPALERSKALIEKRNGLLRQMIAKECQDYGEDLDVAWEHALRNLAEFDSHVSQQRTEYQQAVAARALSDKKPCTIEELAAVDPSLRQMQAIQHALSADADAIEMRLGKADPGAVAAREKFSQRFVQLKKYADELREKFYIRSRPDGKGSMLCPRDLSHREKFLTALLEREVKESERLADLAKCAAVLRRLRGELRTGETYLAVVNETIDVASRREKPPVK